MLALIKPKLFNEGTKKQQQRIRDRNYQEKISRNVITVFVEIFEGKFKRTIRLKL